MNDTKKNELISVILPVYNVEPYLERSICSVISQTYRNLEIILVDDGSTDNGGDVCDRYSLNDQRIRTFHISHRGLGAARNFGFEVSSGKYILYIDPDDRVCENFVETLYERMLETDADFVESRMVMLSPGYLIKPKNRKKKQFGESISGENYLNMIIAGDASVSSCGKLFKRELINKVKSISNRLYEDRALICRLVHNCSNIVMEDNAVYYYYIRRPGSITSTISKKAVLDWLWAYKIFYLECKRYYPELSEKAKQSYRLVYLYIWNKMIERLPFRYLLFPAILKKKNKSAYILLRKIKEYILRHYDDYVKMSFKRSLQVKSVCYFPLLIGTYIKLRRIHI